MVNDPCSGRAGGRHLLISAFVLAVGLIAGCSAVPNQKELAILEEQKEAMAAAEEQVAEKKAEKARLERQLADDKAELRALDEEKAATESNLSGLMSE